MKKISKLLKYGLLVDVKLLKIRIRINSLLIEKNRDIHAW